MPESQYGSGDGTTGQADRKTACGYVAAALDEPGTYGWALAAEDGRTWHGAVQAGSLAEADEMIARAMREALPPDIAVYARLYHRGAGKGSSPLWQPRSRGSLDERMPTLRTLLRETQPSGHPPLPALPAAWRAAEAALPATPVSPLIPAVPPPGGGAWPPYTAAVAGYEHGTRQEWAFVTGSGWTDQGTLPGEAPPGSAELAACCQVADLYPDGASVTLITSSGDLAAALNLALAPPDNATKDAWNSLRNRAGRLDLHVLRVEPHLNPLRAAGPLTRERALAVISRPAAAVVPAVCAHCGGPLPSGWRRFCSTAHKKAAARRHRARMKIAGLEPRTMPVAVPAAGDGTTISCDGSAGHDDSWPGTAGFGGCAAVAETGQALAGWFAVPAGCPVPSYAEVQALRAALILADTVPAVAIASDHTVLVEDATRMQAGEDPQAIGTWVPPELLAEIGDMLRARPDLAITWQGPRARKALAAATPYGTVAHKLASTVYRMTRDGINPAGNGEFLEWAASRDTGQTVRSIRNAYQQWRQARVPAPAPARDAAGDGQRPGAGPSRSGGGDAPGNGEEQHA